MGADYTASNLKVIKMGDVLQKLLASIPNKGVDVNVQDQTTEVIDLHLSQQIQMLAITTDAAIDDDTITVTTGVQPIVGNMVCLKEGTHFYQGEILTSVANSSDWDVGLDTPLDFAFTTLGGCSERNFNLAVNGSVTPVEFSLSPANLDAGIEWDIVRIIFQLLDGSAMDDGLFGGITALTKGIVLRHCNGITKNIFNAKSNGDMASHMYDTEYADKAPSGQFGFRARRTFGGQSKNGVVIRLSSDEEDTLKIIVQDDLTGLISFQVIAQGHVVE